MFSACLVNDPFGDPGVYIEFKYRSRALLFDLGDICNLTPRKLFRISHIFVSHTHMDHFVGFDHLLRVCLGRDLHISLFGPPGFHRQVENKINAYTWNLVENYTNDFELCVTELHPDRKEVRRYRCSNAFRPEIDQPSEPFHGPLVDGSFYSVKGAFLDHKIPCLAYRYEEKSRVNIKKNVLEEMGLPVGAWLVDLKDRILRGDPDDTPIRIGSKHKVHESDDLIMPLGELKEKIVRMTAGQSVTYVTDAIYSEANIAKIIELSDRSEYLFIEGAFLQEDVEKAAQKFHLTALQAGTLARRAGVKRLVLFHFSPKYKGCGHRLVDEAMSAYSGQILLI